MSVHGRSIFQYYNETDKVWVPIPVGDLVSVAYTDKVYAPATAEIVISNKDMNKALSSSPDASTGVYSVEGDAVTTPTFTRFQQIRLLHMPRPLVPIKIVHDNGYANRAGDSQAIFTYANHAMAVGTYVQIVNEESGSISDDLYKIDTVPTSSTFTLDKRGTGANSQKFETSLAGAATEDVSKEAYLQYRSDHALFPYFYGKIDSLDVSYSDSIGKTIHIDASDYLRSLASEVITKSVQSSTRGTQAFNETRLVQADSEETTDQGKFRDTTYNNTRLSATVSEIMNDWSGGKDLYTDNTSDGSTSLGVSKFEDSSYLWNETDLDIVKTYKNTTTTALNAMRSVGMTDPHWSEGVLTHNVEIYYTVADTATLSTSGTRDVLLVYNGGGGTGGVGDTAHLYENGNLIELSNHAPVGSPTPDTIESGTYIVHSKTAYTLKLKFLDGDTVQSPANTATSAAAGTPSKISAGPQTTGYQGYDFYLDAGLYNDVTLTSNTHRPHLNYFMRKSRPVAPGTAGLTAVYPSDDNMTEDDTAFGTKGADQTKVFILEDFDHGLFEEDLYSQVALEAVDDKGMAKGSNNLGHKMEMIKVNSISNSDYVADLSSGHHKYSGALHGNSLFHWNRADDARAYGWFATSPDDIDSALKVNTINVHFFASNGTITDEDDVYERGIELDYASQGTFGVMEAGHGSFRRDEVTGMAGYSALPRGGRSITQSPKDHPVAMTKAYDDFRDDQGVLRAITSTVESPFYMGAESLTSASLIKDMYWCEQEGLLGTEVTAEHDRSTVGITVTAAAHGLETGCLIKVTDIDGTTSGTVQGVKINTSPDEPTESNTTGASTRDNGSYYRVEFLTVDTFNITLPQKHKDTYRNATGAHSGTIAFASGPTGSNVFKYKPVFNVFKDICRVQWQSGSSWTTKEDDVILDSNLVKGAQHILISDVAHKDRPYRGMEVNALVAGFALPGDDSSLHHPVDFHTGSTEEDSYFGFSTVAFSLEADFQAAGDDVTTANVHRYGSDSDDDVRVLFRYGDYVSETRFLYGDSTSTNGSGGATTGIIGVVGRDRSEDYGGSFSTSKDVFKTVNCKVLERFITKRTISKTYKLNFNETFEAPNAARNAAATILKRVILPAQRTTFKVFGYPTIKLVGQGQDGSSGSSLISAQNFASYGGRAGMLLEQVDASDGLVDDAILVPALNATTDVVTADMTNHGGVNWSTSIFYRAFIHLRAGMGIRVEHPAAGVSGNHIITGLKYEERAGNASTMISTTGYDEAIINLMHGNIANAIQTIGSTANNTVITVTDHAGYIERLANIRVNPNGNGTVGPFSQG